MEIEFIETKAADKSGDLYLARVNHLDQQISKLVLGQTTTTDAVSGGHAVAQEHRQVQEDIERDDAITLSATLTRQLVHHIVAFNFGPQPEYPVIVIGRPDEVPIAAVVDALAKLGDKGLVVETSELRDRLGFAEPAPGADVIGTRRVLDAPPPSPALFARAALAPDDDRIEALVGVAAAEAAEPFDALLGRVRATLEGARDLADALARLDRLALDPTALGRALARHGALGYLVGRADAADPE
jgi:phage gp29-like protein